MMWWEAGAVQYPLRKTIGRPLTSPDSGFVDLGNPAEICQQGLGCPGGLNRVWKNLDISSFSVAWISGCAMALGSSGQTAL